MNKILLFSYGSNSTKQIRERLKLKEYLLFKPAYINNHIRIFAGNSKRWNGGVASLYPCKNKITYGITVEITEDQLFILSEYEKGYHLEKKIVISDKKEIESYMYIKDKNRFIKHPSLSYLNAINEMLNERKNIKNIDRKLLIRYLNKYEKISIFNKSINN